LRDKCGLQLLTEQPFRIQPHAITHSAPPRPNRQALPIAVGALLIIAWRPSFFLMVLVGGRELGSPKPASPSPAMEAVTRNSSASERGRSVRPEFDRYNKSRNSPTQFRT